MSRGRSAESLRKRGIAVSVYFPYSERSIIDRLVEWQQLGHIDSMSSYIVGAVRTKMTTSHNIPVIGTETQNQGEV